MLEIIRTGDQSDYLIDIRLGVTLTNGVETNGFTDGELWQLANLISTFTEFNSRWSDVDHTSVRRASYTDVPEPS